MIKKSMLAIITFLVGVLVAHFTEGFFRKLIQNIYEWSTFNIISLHGGDYYQSLDISYLITFGIVFTVFSVLNFKNNINKVLKNIIIAILIFSTSLALLTIIDANIKTIEPTNYEHNIVKWRRNSITYNSLLMMSIFLAVVPSFIKSLRNYSISKR